MSLRTAWVLYRWHNHGPQLDYPDEELHWQLATNLVHSGDLISNDGRFAARMPLYPLFLALFAGVGGHGILVARLAQAALGAVTVGVAYRLSNDVSGRRWAALTGLLVCCDPFGIFFANLLLTETLFTLLAVTFTAWAWHWLARAGHAGLPLLGLAVLGPLLVLTRPSAVGWVVLAWLLLGWLARYGPPPTAPSNSALAASGHWTDHVARRPLSLLVCPLALVVFMFPWGLRNQAVLGSWAWLSTNGGVTLYDAQGPQADGSSNQAFLLLDPELRGLDELALDQTLTRRALRQMWAHPGRVVQLAGVKFLRTWSLTPNVAEYRSGPAAVAGAAYTLLLLLGAVIGTARGVLARRAAPPWFAWRLLAWLPILYFTLVHCVYVGSVRYRAPLMPFLALATGW